MSVKVQHRTTSLAELAGDRCHTIVLIHVPRVPGNLEYTEITLGQIDSMSPSECATYGDVLGVRLCKKGNGHEGACRLW